MHKPLAVAGAAAMIAVLAACGGSSGGSGGDTEGSGTATGGTGQSTSAPEGQGEPVIIGTTDKVTALDPAGSYDLGSWTLQYNMYQTLLTIPAGQNKPEGDAAKSCEYKNPKTLVCKLKPGLKFWNGHPLTSSDVKYSLERNIRIADPNGASGLLASIAKSDKKGNLSVDPKAIETPNDTTIIFHLNKPDTTFQFVLTTNAADIVDEDVFPADKKLPDNKIVGSGPYKLAEYKAGEQAVFTLNPYYNGPKKGKAPQIFVRYEQTPTNLKQDVENGSVDIAWRSLSPEDLSDLKKSGKVTVATGKGSEIRYWVWKVDGPLGKNPAIRKAVAYLVDRQDIAQTAYDGTVDPLYSIVPPGFPGQIPAFKKAYGASPSKAKAAQVLKKAGVQTPVKLTLGYTTSHYGPNAVDEATALQRQLEKSGLFKVELKSAEWTQYQNLYKQGAYDLFQLGWFPDFLDADNYLAPFLVDGGFYANGYTNKTVNKLVAQEEGSPDASKRETIFEKLQNITAKDVPLIPTWVGKNVAVYGPGVQGVEKTLDPSFIFRFWVLSKSS